MAELTYDAWVLIANAMDRIDDPEWTAAATRWREEWHKTLAAPVPTDAPGPGLTVHNHDPRSCEYCAVLIQEERVRVGVVRGHSDEDEFCHCPDCVSYMASDR